jgi:EAL domain-containing protein (putative c-di-GMP-specific phosphodiesterase class I)
VEITESLLIEDDKYTLQQLNELQKLGVQIAIDDFGTGYSSLSYLKRFPLNKLKIDKSFVQDLSTNFEDKALVNAIISMAHSLGLEVVAEGVEHQQQLDWLFEKDVNFIQGYIYSKPLSASEFLHYCSNKISSKRA